MLTSDFGLKEFQEFVEGQTWRFAKTYAKNCPHEYIVKGKLPEPLWPVFEQAVQFIRDAGFEALYGRRRGLYLILGEHYYWTMGAPIPETIILNRASLSDWELREGKWFHRKVEKDKGTEAGEGE